MAAKYIIGSVAASFAFAYVSDRLVSDNKLFGGELFHFNRECLKAKVLILTLAVVSSTSQGLHPRTVKSNKWWEETDKKFQAWPRTAGPPVVMNPSPAGISLLIPVLGLEALVCLCFFLLCPFIVYCNYCPT
ncbi:hypothetical protein V6N12_018865 [Hibiscus sabdariffa]|uniref:Uncharacterized protein n=1 Tax=Hibiscus sabdariffa TaxID=183260 RepID=A0ABR2AT39_9ROSI